MSIAANVARRRRQNQNVENALTESQDGQVADIDMVLSENNNNSNNSSLDSQLSQADSNQRDDDDRVPRQQPKTKTKYDCSRRIDDTRKRNAKFHDKHQKMKQHASFYTVTLSSHCVFFDKLKRTNIVLAVSTEVTTLLHNILNVYTYI